jgi:phosphoribosylformimino-5-aminoimidazole carboxamide ribotide isomerase
MRVLPVLDLMGGQVVRGVGGRRGEYRPVVSPLTPSTRPLDVARAFRHQFALTELYVADLDAIAGSPPAFSVYEGLHDDGFRLWVDAGLREAEPAAALLECGVAQIILGLETVERPETVADACQRFGSERIVFSLDLKEGVPLGNERWGSTDPLKIADRAVSGGVERMIVLDLSRVGTGRGTATDALCHRLIEEYPGLKLVAGGGVYDRADLERLKRGGLFAVLVASALHDGRLRREDIEAL